MLQLFRQTRKHSWPVIPRAQRSAPVTQPLSRMLHIDSLVPIAAGMR